MKLFARYSRANILAAMLILLVSSISYYFIIRSILIQQIDKDLKVEEQEIHEYIKENRSLPVASSYKGQVIRFEIVQPGTFKRSITTHMSLETKDDDEPVRELTFPVTVNGALYKAIVIKSQVETEELVKVIVWVTVAIFLLLLLIVSILNRFLLSKIWEPFYLTLKKLKTYDVETSKVLQLEKTDIDEFNELNTSVTEMTRRVNRDFEALKSFTDNASHEIQTPLAVIRSKLDILLQVADQKQAKQLQGIYNATSRLSTLNKTLLLLAKINNKQFDNQRTVDWKVLVEQKLQQFDELINDKNIRISLEMTPVFVEINGELADILLNNLFSNAIKHNVNAGYISCNLTSEAFTITNSGIPLTFDPDHIFDRFQKSDHSTGTGLGLAVAKQICDNAGLKLLYTSNNDDHTFTILFN